MEAGASTTASSAPKVEIHLEDVPLWEEFCGATNEMIVSRPGRMMFPAIRVRIGGLDPNALYTVLLAFRQLGDTRWKYVDGEWKSGKRQFTLAITAPSARILINLKAAKQGEIRVALIPGVGVAGVDSFPMFYRSRLE